MSFQKIFPRKTIMFFMKNLHGFINIKLSGIWGQRRSCVKLTCERKNPTKAIMKELTSSLCNQTLRVSFVIDVQQLPPSCEKKNGIWDIKRFMILIQKSNMFFHLDYDFNYNIVVTSLISVIAFFFFYKFTL